VGGEANMAIDEVAGVVDDEEAVVVGCAGDSAAIGRGSATMGGGSAGRMEGGGVVAGSCMGGGATARG